MADAVEGVKPRVLPEIEVACRLSGLEALTIRRELIIPKCG